MDLSKALENMKFDVRMKDWNMKQGLIKKEDIETSQKSLPDASAQCEPVTLEDRDFPE